MTFEDKFHEAEKGAEARADAERQRKHTGSQANTQLPRELAPDQPISELEQFVRFWIGRPDSYPHAEKALTELINSQVADAWRKGYDEGYVDGTELSAPSNEVGGE